MCSCVLPAPQSLLQLVDAAGPEGTAAAAAAMLHILGTEGEGEAGKAQLQFAWSAWSACESVAGEGVCVGG